MRWFNKDLGEYISMYQSGEEDQSVILCERPPCVVLTTSRIVKKPAEDDHNETAVDMLMPCAAWTSQLVTWRNNVFKNSYIENRCSMYKFSNIQEFIKYVRLLWLLRDEIPCFSYKIHADEQRLRLITDVNDLKSTDCTTTSAFIRPYFCISE